MGNAIVGEVMDNNSAYQLHLRIVARKRSIEENFFGLAEDLYVMEAKKKYKELNYDTFNDYIDSPEVNMSRATVFRLKAVYGAFISSRKVSQGILLEAGYRKSAMVAPYIKRMDAEELLAQAATNSRTQLKIWIRETFPKDKEREIADYSHVRLLRGDMAQLLPDLGKFDVIITDPPYGVTSHEWDTAEHGRWLGIIREQLANEYTFMWFCPPALVAETEYMLEGLAMPVQSRIVWHRRNMSMGSAAKNKFVDTWEMIFHCGNRPLNFPEEWSDAWFDVQTFAVPQSQFTDAKLHPTQKPEALMRRLVEFGTFPGDKLLDPFAGSGTTGYVCPPDRECTLIERQYDYATIIEQRLAIHQDGGGEVQAGGDRQAYMGQDI